MQKKFFSKEAKPVSTYRMKIIEGDGVACVSVAKDKGNTYNTNEKPDPEGTISGEYKDKKPYKRGTILRKLGIWKENSGKN